MKKSESQKDKSTIRLNFEFPRKEYPYLKMVCASKGISIKDFATEILIREIERAEEEMLLKNANDRLETMQEEDLIPWDEAKRLAGWDDEKV